VTLTFVAWWLSMRQAAPELAAVVALDGPLIILAALPAAGA
jgi:hypothetical protein